MAAFQAKCQCALCKDIISPLKYFPLLTVNQVWHVELQLRTQVNSHLELRKLLVPVNMKVRHSQSFLTFLPLPQKILCLPKNKVLPYPKINEWSSYFNPMQIKETPLAIFCMNHSLLQIWLGISLDVICFSMKCTKPVTGKGLEWIYLGNE